MTLRLITSLAILFATAPTAHAKCQTLINQAERLSGERLVAGYESVIRCSAKEAQPAFFKFMQQAGEPDTLAALSLVAIDSDIWTPVWEMIGKISDYSARDEVAELVGNSCNEHPKVISFLQGAYFGLRDIEFQQWDDALASCDSEEFQAWMVQTIESPPPKLYDEKWETVTKAFVVRQRTASLSTLVNAAAKASENGGPFDAILAHMESAVMPEFGIEISVDGRESLEKSLLDLAKQIAPDRARAVAGKLSNAGSESAAASLLPTIYPDRVQTGGGFLYGAAAVESGVCDGANMAVLHVALVTETGKHYQLQSALEGPMRQLKGRLTKCQVVEPWPIVVSGTPLGKKDDIEPFVDQLSTMWTMKGYEVRRRNEKTVDIP